MYYYYLIHYYYLLIYIVLYSALIKSLNNVCQIKTHMILINFFISKLDYYSEY